jgi:hypothetical protein
VGERGYRNEMNCNFPRRNDTTELENDNFCSTRAAVYKMTHDTIIFR